MKSLGIFIGFSINIFYTLELKNRLLEVKRENLIIKDYLRKENTKHPSRTYP